jgi:hypothetical protein
MLEGFSDIFPKDSDTHIIVSEEAKTYRPEMEWLAANIQNRKIQVHDDQFTGYKKGDSVYRFFELFDLDNVANAKDIFNQAEAGRDSSHTASKNCI